MGMDDYGISLSCINDILFPYILPENFSSILFYNFLAIALYP
jgi:hypothetical protein